MNEKLLQQAMQRLDSMTPSQLFWQLVRHGIQVEPKEPMTTDLEKRVREVVGMHLGVAADDVKNEHRFVEDFGADSLDLVELCMGLEDEFDIEISEEQADEITTVQHAINFVAARLGVELAKASPLKMEKAPEAPAPEPTGKCANPACEECEGFDINYKPQFDRELRLYCFGNYYLSSIQQGIQTGHAAVAMVRKYCNNGNPLNREITADREAMVAEWADDHKTFITLQGGNNKDLHDILELAANSGFPWVPFYEDEQSLGGILTAVAVVLPDDIFNLRREKNIRGEPYYSWIRETDDGGRIIYQISQEHELFPFVDMLKSKGLAK